MNNRAFVVVCFHFTIELSVGPRMRGKDWRDNEMLRKTIMLTYIRSWSNKAAPICSTPHMIFTWLAAHTLFLLYSASMLLQFLFPLFSSDLPTSFVCNSTASRPFSCRYKLIVLCKQNNLVIDYVVQTEYVQQHSFTVNLLMHIAVFFLAWESTTFLICICLSFLFAFMCFYFVFRFSQFKVCRTLK